MLTLDEAYSCEDDVALARMHALADYWLAKYKIRTTWNGTKARIEGKVLKVKFEGDIAVESGSVSAQVKAGFLAEKLGGKKYVQRKVREYLDLSVSLEELQARAR